MNTEVPEGRYWEEEPSRKGSIPEHVESLAAQTKQLHGTVEKLCARLDPILGPASADVTDRLAGVPTTGSTIATQLTEIRGSLEELDGRLRSLINRVEL